MYMKPGIKNPQFGCYSERGLMSYFMFVDLPKLMLEFLQALEFSSNKENPFKEITITNPIIYSELDLGKTVGFGCPDGAIYFEYKKDNKPFSTMILIEVKANETYEKSCNKGNKGGYNSTIKGQLELRWRMKELLLNDCFCNENAEHYENEKKKYLREIKQLSELYNKPPCDEFYTKEKKDAEKPKARWRRLIINEGGVKEFIDKLKECKNEVYFLVISKGTNPFNNESHHPRCYTIETNSELNLDAKKVIKLDCWDTAKEKFCWLPVTKIEDSSKLKP